MSDKKLNLEKYLILCLGVKGVTLFLVSLSNTDRGHNIFPM